MSATSRPVDATSGLDKFVSAVVEGDSCTLCPASFFVAWNGVLTLAFTGFPSALVQLKEAITEEFGLCDENFGSKWPKITLGALAGPDLVMSLEQLQRLAAVCSDFGRRVRDSGWAFRPSAASAVLFQCRSLEKCIVRCDVPFSPAPSSELRPSSCDSCSESLAPEQRRLVDSVLAEGAMDRLEEYLDKVNKPGNRMDHYRENHAEATLVCFVPEAQRPAELMEAFQRAVDEALPGMYAWMAPDSWHVTLRTLT